jgi:hypothetical protein
VTCTLVLPMARAPHLHHDQATNVTQLTSRIRTMGFATRSKGLLLRRKFGEGGISYAADMESANVMLTSNRIVPATPLIMGDLADQWTAKWLGAEHVCGRRPGPREDRREVLPSRTCAGGRLGSEWRQHLGGALENSATDT